MPIKSNSTIRRPKFEFPLTVYDRPAISLANLLEGNIDAATRAIFSPMTLTPTEMKNVRQAFMGDTGKDDPIIRTAVDIATNPIVILGLIMAVGSRGAVANPAQLWKMFSGAGEAMPSIQPFMRALVSPFTGLRAVWHRGVWPLIGKVIQNDQWFRRMFQGRYDKAVAEFVKLDGAKIGFSPERSSLVTFWMEEMHKIPRVTAVKFGKKTKELLESSWFQGTYRKHFGMEGPLMANLEAAMKAESPHLLPLAKKLRGDVYGRAGKLLFGNEFLQRELEAKGVGYLDSYSHRIVSRLGGLKELFKIDRGTEIRAYRAFQRRMSEGGIRGAPLKRRTLMSMPNMVETNTARDYIMGKHGIDIFGLGMHTKFQSLAPTMRGNVEVTLRGMVERIRVGRMSFEESDKILKGLFQRTRPHEFGGLEDMGLTEQGITSVRNMLRAAVGRGEAATETAIKAISGVAGTPAEFITRTDQIIPTYIRATAPTYAWHSFKPGILAQTNPRVATAIRAQGVGPALHSAATGTGEWAGKGPLVEYQQAITNMVTEDLFPMIRGLKHWREYKASILFRDTAQKFQQMLAPNTYFSKMLPARSREWLLNAFSGARGGITESTMGGRIASLLYTSALGMNMSPISKNILQPLLTTMPMVGPKNLALGMQEVAKRMQKYPALSAKIGKEKAFKRLFGGYAKYFGHEDIIKAMAAGDIAREGKMMGKAASTVLQRGQQVLMTPFGVSEKWNRLVSFYAGQAGGLASGLTKARARELGSWVTQFTQFTGGTTGLPAWARGQWAPFRQFGHFPSRYLEYLYGTMRMGPDPAQRATGILGRSMVASAALYTVAKNVLKMDVSGGLMVHALPGPVYESSSFYPAPYIPPIVGAMGDVVKAFHTGDFSRLGGTAALLTPGGLAARRAWRTYHPKYADYRARTPDGRIPIYNDSHALIGAQTPMQVAMRGLGLRPVEVQAETEMVRYLLAQRDKIREYRREYLETLLENNLEKARQINADFQKEYPDLGPLTVKKSDITAVKNRKEISRMNRVLKGFPKAYQPLFQSMMEQATLSQIGRDIDYNPEVLQQYLPQ